MKNFFNDNKSGELTIRFNNVPQAGIKFPSGPYLVSGIYKEVGGELVKYDGASEVFAVNCIDIDWNECLPEVGVTIKTTGDLIRWIKKSISTSGNFDPSKFKQNKNVGYYEESNDNRYQVFDGNAIIDDLQDKENWIDTKAIKNGAITTPKIADNAVTEPKLADNSVSTRTIQNLAVTKDKLAPGLLKYTNRVGQDENEVNKIGTLKFGNEDEIDVYAPKGGSGDGILDVEYLTALNTYNTNYGKLVFNKYSENKKEVIIKGPSPEEMSQYTAGDGIDIDENGVISVTEASDLEIGGIKLGYSENGKNYPVELDETSRKAFVHVPWSSSEDPNTGKYYDLAFKTTNDKTPVPAVPDLYFPNGNDGWKHYAENATALLYVWMCTRLTDAEGNGLEEWNGPWLISGPEGRVGEDGKGIEFVYTRTVTSEPPSANLNSHLGKVNGLTVTYVNTLDDFVPNGWYDNPQGVERDVPYEWVGIRTSNGEGIWSDFQGPFLWSHFGKNGTDGDGVEYIYYANNVGSIPVGVVNWPNEWDTTAAEFQEYEYTGPTGSPWTDNPWDLETLGEGSKEWVSMRKMNHTTGEWGAFSTPALWSYIPRNGVAEGYIVDLTNENMPIVVLSDGTVSGYTNESYVLALHNGTRYTNFTIAVGTITRSDGASVTSSNASAAVDNVNKKITVTVTSLSNFSGKNLYIPITITLGNGTTRELLITCYGVQMGETGGHYEFRYKNASSRPANPTGDGTVDGWSATATTPSSGTYTWMSQAFVSGNTYGTWTTPIRITGEKGDDGADGTEYEFIYTRNNDGHTPETPATTQEKDWSGEYNGVVWTDNPAGVLENLKYEFVSTRSCTDGTWGAYSTPVIWSKWGEKGMDGDGYEYIYKHFTSEQTWGLNNDNPAYWAANLNREYYGPTGYQWSDDPTGISSTNKYEYVSTRKCTNGTWSQFSTPVLWSNYTVSTPSPGENGSSLDLKTNAEIIRTNYDLTSSTPSTITVWAQQVSGTTNPVVTSYSPGSSAASAVNLTFKYLYYNDTNNTQSTELTLSLSYITVSQNTSSYTGILIKLLYNGSLIDSKQIPFVKDGAPYIGAGEVMYKIQALNSTVTCKYEAEEDPADWYYTGALYFKIFKIIGGEYIELNNENDVTYNYTTTQITWKANSEHGDGEKIKGTIGDWDGALDWDNSLHCWVSLVSSNVLYDDTLTAPCSVISVSSSTGTVLESLIIPFIMYGKDGQNASNLGYLQGLQGVVMRFSTGILSNGTYTFDTSRYYYDGQATDTDGVYYLDVVQGYDGSYYRVKTIANIHKALGSTLGAPISNLGVINNNWEIFTPSGAAAFLYMIANNAYIQNLTAKNIVITQGTGNNTTVVAGMVSGAYLTKDSNTDEFTVTDTSTGSTYTSNGVRIFAGPPTDANLTTCPFYVDNTGAGQLAGGKITWSKSNNNWNLNILGGVSTESLEIQRSSTINGTSGTEKLNVNINGGYIYSNLYEYNNHLFGKALLIYLNSITLATSTSTSQSTQMNRYCKINPEFIDIGRNSGDINDLTGDTYIRYGSTDISLNNSNGYATIGSSGYNILFTLELNSVTLSQQGIDFSDYYSDDASSRVLLADGTTKPISELGGVTGRYLPLTGGTLTGELALNGGLVLGGNSKSRSVIYTPASDLTLCSDYILIGPEQSDTEYDDDDFLIQMETSEGNIYASTVYATVSSSSDKNLKDIISDTILTIEQIANAPAINFTWKRDSEKENKKEHVGTLAQYWKDILPQVVSETKNNTLAFEYGNAAMVSSIITAREVVVLKLENQTLKERLSALEEKINLLIQQ